MFSNWNSVRIYKGKILRFPEHTHGVADRQRKIPGFSQEILSSKTAVCAGAGGLMSGIGEALARKGIKEIRLCDMDTVEPSNLNRQKFYQRDLWKNKAFCLARNLAKESFLGTTVVGIACTFMEAVARGFTKSGNVIVSAIDNDLGREEIAEYALDTETPAITVGVSKDGDSGYVHVQKPGEACWGCAFPRPKRLRDDWENYRSPCPGSPAIKDILLLVGGAAVYALDALFMDRPISWNYREFHLAGFMPDITVHLPRLPNCHLCGSVTPQRREVADERNPSTNFYA